MDTKRLMRFIRRAAMAMCLSMAVTATGHAGGRPRPVYVQSTNVTVVSPVRPTMDVRNGVAPSPMLGSFTPNQSVWVRGNGVMGGGYTPLNQDERESMAIYGPFSAFRGQMKPVKVLQPTGTGPIPLMEGDAVAYPNFPWKDSLPNLSSQGRAVRPRSPFVYPGWNTDADTIDQQ